MTKNKTPQFKTPQIKTPQIREMAKNKTPQLKTPQICKLCSVPKTPQIPSFRQKFVRTVKFTSSWGFSAIVRNIILAVLGKTYP